MPSAVVTMGITKVAIRIAGLLRILQHLEGRLVTLHDAVVPGLIPNRRNRPQRKGPVVARSSAPPGRLRFALWLRKISGQYESDSESERGISSTVDRPVAERRKFNDSDSDGY